MPISGIISVINETSVWKFTPLSSKQYATNIAKEYRFKTVVDGNHSFTIIPIPWCLLDFLEGKGGDEKGY